MFCLLNSAAVESFRDDDDLDQGGLKNSGATEIRWGLKKGGSQIGPAYLFLLVGGLIMKYRLGNFATLLQIFQVPKIYVVSTTRLVLTRIRMILMCVFLVANLNSELLICLLEKGKYYRHV